jgi:hypothetical protein
MAENHLNYRYRSILIGQDGRQLLTRFMEIMEKKLQNSGSMRSTLGDPHQDSNLLMAEIETDPDIIDIDNRGKRRQEIQLLQRDLDDGILTPEEYDRECQRIRAKYPV